MASSDRSELISSLEHTAKTFELLVRILGRRQQNSSGKSCPLEISLDQSWESRLLHGAIGFFFLPRIEEQGAYCSC